MKRTITTGRLAAVIAAASMLMLTGCGKELHLSDVGTRATTSPSAENNDTGKDDEIKSSDGRSFIITLHPDTAPITCENFEKLVNEGFYDGLTFHRVVDNFMAQGGDPEGTGSGGSTSKIKGEFSSNGVENNLSHKRGVVSMARSKAPDSATSQFFICYTDCSASLDGSYAAFGEVTEGMDVVDSFTEVPRSANSFGENAVPDTPIIMEKVQMIDPDEDGEPRVKVTMNDFLEKQ